MNSETKQVEKGFLGRWVLYTSLAWIIGLIVSILVSYFLVNLIYPKETNLVVGLCVGAIIGYAQWLVLKKRINLSSEWILTCAIGMGIPFIVDTLLDEAGVNTPDSWTAQLLARIVIGIAGGLLVGLLQWRRLKSISTKAAWWILACVVGWGFGWLSSIGGPLGGIIGLIAGGIVLGFITGISMKCILKYSTQEVIIEAES